MCEVGRWPAERTGDACESLCPCRAEGAMDAGSHYPGLLATPREAAVRVAGRGWKPQHAGLQLLAPFHPLCLFSMISSHLRAAKSLEGGPARKLCALGRAREVVGWSVGWEHRVGCLGWEWLGGLSPMPSIKEQPRARGRLHLHRPSELCCTCPLPLPYTPTPSQLPGPSTSATPPHPNHTPHHTHTHTLTHASHHTPTHPIHTSTQLHSTPVRTPTHKIHE